MEPPGYERSTPMIIVERGTRKVLYADPVTPEQRQRAWEYLIRLRGPALIREEMERLRKEKESEHAGS